MKRLFWVVIPLMTDQVSKWWFEPDVQNFGGLWGWAPELGWSSISLMVLLMVGIWAMKNAPASEKIGLLIVFGAGLSNLIDRVLLGGVRDFIWWPLLNVYGNLADVWLFIGAMVVIWGMYGRVRTKNLSG